MKLGMNLLLWTTYLTREQFGLLKSIQQAGFDGVEILLNMANPDNYKEVKNCLGDLGLEVTTIAVLDAAANPISSDSSVRQEALDQLRWAVDISTELGSEVLGGPFHSTHGAFSGMPPSDEELTWCAEVLGTVARHAGQNGVTLAVESLNRFECYLLTTVEQALQLVRQVGDPALGILYDTHHAHIEEKDISLEIRRAGSDIKHVHVSENHRGAPGDGLVDWKTTFRALQDIKYDGWMVIEAFSQLTPEWAPALRVWRNFAASPEEVYKGGSLFIREMWEQCSAT